MKHSLLPLAAVAALTAPAHAQIPAEIQSLLDQSAAAYRNAASLSMTLETAQGSGGGKTTVKLALVRPGKLSATITSGDTVRHVVADGTTAYSDVSTDKAKYIKQPAAALSDAVGALAQSRGAGVGLLPILLTQPNAEKMIIPGKPTKVEKREDTTVGGVACDVVVATLPSQKPMEYHFALGKTDHLLRRLTIRPADGAPLVTETYSDVTVGVAPPASAFTYTPAAGAVATAPPKDPPMYDERLKVGATPFKLVGVDLAGKPVSYDDYKGKVLLVDFWATWCGPCVAELPNVIAAYGKFHGQGFEVLGISLDRKDDRAKLEKFIQDKNMPWRQIYDGKFWQAANAQAYGVQAIPFTLLIGKDGKIAAVGARGEALAPAIEAALKK